MGSALHPCFLKKIADNAKVDLLKHPVQPVLALAQTHGLSPKEPRP